MVSAIGVPEQATVLEAGIELVMAAWLMDCQSILFCRVLKNVSMGWYFTGRFWATVEQSVGS